jgi:hypothetical protein
MGTGYSCVKFPSIAATGQKFYQKLCNLSLPKTAKTTNFTTERYNTQTSVAGPDPRPFLPLDPGWVRKKNKIKISGSVMNIPDYIREIKNKFLVKNTF